MSSLMTISYDIITSARINMSFDDGISKKVLVSPGDIVTVIYNHNGERTSVTGKITKIISDTTNNCGCSTTMNWVMALDASSYGGSTINRINLGKILDITLVRSAADYDEITSPTGEYNVSNLRLVGNILQLSVDNGTTWLNVTTLPAVDLDLDESDAIYIEQVKQILPSNLRPDTYAVLLKNMVSLLKTAAKSSEDDSSNEYY